MKQSKFTDIELATVHIDGLEKALQSITNILFDFGYCNTAPVPVDILRRIVIDVKNNVRHDYNEMVTDYLKSYFNTDKEHLS